MIGRAARLVSLRCGSSSAVCRWRVLHYSSVQGPLEHVMSDRKIQSKCNALEEGTAGQVQLQCAEPSSYASAVLHAEQHPMQADSHGHYAPVAERAFAPADVGDLAGPSGGFGHDETCRKIARLRLAKFRLTHDPALKNNRDH